jgi:hypothetical protein
MLLVAFLFHATPGVCHDKEHTSMSNLVGVAPSEEFRRLRLIERKALRNAQYYHRLYADALIRLGPESTVTQRFKQFYEAARVGWENANQAFHRAGWGY